MSAHTSHRPGVYAVAAVKQPFEAVVSQHGRTVLRVCRAILGAADADDAWSDTFLSALEAYPRLPVDANVEAWLVTIAHRKAIDVTRRAGRRPMPVAEVPPKRQEPATSTGTSISPDLWPTSPKGNDLPLCTTTSLDCRTSRLPPSSAAVSRPPAGQPPTVSPTFVDHKDRQFDQ